LTFIVVSNFQAYVLFPILPTH